MYLYEVETESALLYGERTSGPYIEAASSIHEGMALLAAASCREGSAKVQVIELGPGAEPPNENQRATLAEIFRSDPSPRIFAFVGTSWWGRSAVDTIYQPGGRSKHRQRAFATFEEAVEWVNELRPGSKIGLMQLRLRVQARRLNVHRMPAMA